jgi:hypothetical protein
MAGRCLFFFCVAFCVVPALTAQTKTSGRASLGGLTLNGASGLYTVPSGRLGWGQNSSVGVDVGSSYNFFGKNWITKAGVSLFNWVEITGMVDAQPRTNDRNNLDGMIGAKLRFPTNKTAVAAGGNVQFLNNNDKYTTSGQIYAAITYQGEFFTWPAETSLTLGYTFRDSKSQAENIDFGMGLDLLLLPDVFGNFVHWIVDFSNFSYSDQALGANAWHRGCLNTGLRINLGAIPALNRLKFIVDLMLLDILDGDRSIAMGIVFGLPLK